MKKQKRLLSITNWDEANTLYIYTLPKAGTYLLSSVLEELGVPNSGFHISFTSYLDTLGFTPEISRSLPSSTRISGQYIKTFKQAVGKIAFGHLSPSFLPPGVLRKTNVIASYRDPMEVLVSEFNDFRFIRSDVSFCSREVEADDSAAFTLYLERHAIIIRDIMVEMCRYLDSFANTLYRPKYAEQMPIVVNYNLLRDPDYLAKMDLFFHHLLPESQKTFSHALDETFSKPTKTKSSGYSFDLQSLWTESNQRIVKQLRLKRLYRHIVKQDNAIFTCL